MRWRNFIAIVAGATMFWPLATHAQQDAKPVIGYLSGAAIKSRPTLVASFREGLGEEGFFEGKNVMIEYRTANGKAERLPELAADLVRRRVAVISSIGSLAALAAKRATRSIPIVITTGGDPVEMGLVSSLNRPNGNITGTYFLFTGLVTKRFSLLHELAPLANRFAVLVNSADPRVAEAIVREVTIAARVLGLDVKVFNVGTPGEIDAAFADLVAWWPDALFAGPGAFLAQRRLQLATLAARHALPASYSNRVYVEAGGLMSYGPRVEDNYRQVGVYVGRILKGARPIDLPIVQPTRFELVINLKAAKALGIAVPPKLLARADEVIE